MILNTTYNIWKQIVQNHSWATYHLVDSGTRVVWSGDRDHIYTSNINDDDLSDWQTNFETDSILVTREDDAVAQIIGLSGVLPIPQANIPPETIEKIIVGSPLVVEGNTSDDTEYVITSGKTFTIKKITLGATGNPTENGSMCEIIYEDGYGEHIVDILFTAGSTQSEGLPDTDNARDGTVMVGDGVAKIIIRRTRLSIEDQKVDTVVKGFEK